jgi:hypothetical protein
MGVEEQQAEGGKRDIRRLTDPSCPRGKSSRQMNDVFRTCWPPRLPVLERHLLSDLDRDQVGIEDPAQSRGDL